MIKKIYIVERYKNGKWIETERYFLSPWEFMELKHKLLVEHNERPKEKLRIRRIK